MLLKQKSTAFVGQCFIWGFEGISLSAVLHSCSHSCFFGRNSVKYLICSKKDVIRLRDIQISSYVVESISRPNALAFVVEMDFETRAKQ